jgi:hypothetical protein
MQILVDDLFATELNPADHITRGIAECFHGLLPDGTPAPIFRQVPEVEVYLPSAVVNFWFATG